MLLGGSVSEISGDTFRAEVINSELLFKISLTFVSNNYIILSLFHTIFNGEHMGFLTSEFTSSLHTSDGV